MINWFGLIVSQSFFLLIKIAQVILSLKVNQVILSLNVNQVILSLKVNHWVKFFLMNAVQFLRFYIHLALLQFLLLHFVIALLWIVFK